MLYNEITKISILPLNLQFRLAERERLVSAAFSVSWVPLRPGAEINQRWGPWASPSTVHGFSTWCLQHVSFRVARRLTRLAQVSRGIYPQRERERENQAESRLPFSDLASKVTCISSLPSLGGISQKPPPGFQSREHRAACLSI